MSKSFVNVWDAIIEDKAERANLKIRSELMIRLENYISDNNLTQEKAAEIFGIKQPRVSDIVKGKINKFTIDYLVNMAGKAGIDVKICCVDTISQSFDIRSDSKQPKWPMRLIKGGKKNPVCDWGTEMSSHNTLLTERDNAYVKFG